MKFSSYISKLLNKDNSADKVNYLNSSWKIQDEEFEYLSGTASGSLLVEPTHILKSGFETETDSEIAILTKSYRMLEERLKFVENRQKASESTQTEWILDNKSKIEFLEKEIFKNEKTLLRENLNKLIEIGKFEDNWNQYGAKKFDPSLIFQCMQIVTRTELKYQPEIFPTGRQSIQFEYEPDENNYLEMEIFENKIKLYKRIDSKIESEVNIDLQTAINQINDFQSKF